MRRLGFELLAWCLAAAAMLFAVGSRASTFNVVISDTSALSSDPQVLLVFDFTNGDPSNPINTVKLFDLTQAGQTPPASITGNVTEDTLFGPWTFSDAPVPPDPAPSFFNELQVSFQPIGSSISFSFTTTDNPPQGTPDGFSFFILGPDQDFLITTDDPTGSNALFLYSIGNGDQDPSVYKPAEQGLSFTVTRVRSAPEPTSLALLAAGLFGLSARRRRGA